MILSLLISSMRIKKKVLSLENAWGQDLLVVLFFPAAARKAYMGDCRIFRKSEGVFPVS